LKKLVVAFMLLVSASAFAGGGHHHGHHGYWRHEGGGNSWGWVAPAVIGGALVYSVTRPPVYVQPAPQPVVIQQQPVIVQGQNCSPWTQVMNPDGTVTTTRTCTQQ
jgi:hypothetical protein